MSVSFEEAIFRGRQSGTGQLQTVVLIHLLLRVAFSLDS